MLRAPLSISLGSRSGCSIRKAENRRPRSSATVACLRVGAKSRPSHRMFSSDSSEVAFSSPSPWEPITAPASSLNNPELGQPLATA